MAPIAPPARRVEHGDALMPSSQTDYQRVIYESRESWGGLLFPIWQKGDQARGKAAARGMRLRALFSPLSGWVNFCRAYGVDWVSDSRLLLAGG
jgi:hypothetical protein